MKKAIIIEADRIEDTDGERIWLDLIDKISKIVYSSDSNYDAMNLQMRRLEEH